MNNNCTMIRNLCSNTFYYCDAFRVSLSDIQGLAVTFFALLAVPTVFDRCWCFVPDSGIKVWIVYWFKYWHTLISKNTSGFRSNTLLIRFPIMVSVYIVYRMHKVMKRMVKMKCYE